MSELQKSENTSDFVSIKAEYFLELLTEFHEYKSKINELEKENQEQKIRMEKFEKELTLLKRLYFEKQQPIKKETMKPESKSNTTDEKANPVQPKNYAELKNLQRERGYLSSREVTEIFQISKRTLQNYRDNDLISFYTADKSRKIWYKLDELEALFKRRKTNNTDADAHSA
ncbi:MAG: helix-turn-helix domain-containing protein [Bacteroidales bacterium]|nr:helix-turn-helix domain-containing protein [Bacteroidales bacterium]